MDLYSIPNSPRIFGDGAGTPASEAIGDFFAVTGDYAAFRNMLFLPEGQEAPYYVNFTMVFASQSLDTLGADVGTYVWSWGSAQDGVNGDSVTLNVIDPTVVPPAATTPVPIFGAFGLMGLAGAIGAAGVAMNRRRKQ